MVRDHFTASYERLTCSLAFTGNVMETVLTKHGKVQTQGRNIRHYANYLTERAKAYRDTKCDFVRGAEHRLEKLSVDKGLLRETEIVQHQIGSLLKCDVGCSVYKSTTIY
jgi:hypothetical protein